ncbi:hypothetical protein, partial [Pseudomonas sp. GW704-F5]|uniref:hypothetical protein n=1 Tax=Pseudomonas sp. GW704-F5 TaxID=2070576 RepID=UPI000CB23335
FVAVEDNNDFNTYGVGQVLFYDKKDGTLALNMVSASGSADFKTDWTITASAGVSEAVRQNMAAAKSSADASRADRLLADADAASARADAT